MFCARYFQIIQIKTIFARYYISVTVYKCGSIQKLCDLDETCLGIVLSRRNLPHKCVIGDRLKDSMILMGPACISCLHPACRIVDVLVAEGWSFLSKWCDCVQDFIDVWNLGFESWMFGRPEGDRLCLNDVIMIWCDHVMFGDHIMWCDVITSCDVIWP